GVVVLGAKPTFRGRSFRGRGRGSILRFYWIEFVSRGATPRETNFASQTADRPRTWESSFPNHGVAPQTLATNPAGALPQWQAAGLGLAMGWLAQELRTYVKGRE